jgi:hypothetical protein
MREGLNVIEFGLEGEVPATVLTSTAIDSVAKAPLADIALVATAELSFILPGMLTILPG